MALAFNANEAGRNVLRSCCVEAFVAAGELGVRRVLVYCSDYKCSHSIELLDADQWPDDLRLSDIEPRFICQACGRRGADVRPNFPRTRMGS